MKKYIVEFIGTFFLVFIIGLTTKNIVDWQVAEATIFGPIAIGSVLMALIYMGYSISGAHYNPAVTLSVWMNKKISGNEAVIYVLIQILAGLMAALSIFIFFEQVMVEPKPYHGFSYNLKPIALEAMYTFVLVIVILNTAMSNKTKGNSYYGLAIGFTVMAGIFAVGPITGGTFNPAVGIGPIVINSIIADGTLINLPVYIIGPLLGAIVAALLYKYLETE